MNGYIAFFKENGYQKTAECRFFDDERVGKIVRILGGGSDCQNDAGR